MINQRNFLLGLVLGLVFGVGLGAGWMLRSSNRVNLTETDPTTPETFDNYVSIFDGSQFQPPKGAVKGPGEWGPWNKRLMLARSDDGLTFTRTNTIVTDQGDVPDLVVDSDGRIYLYYTGWTVGDEQNKTVVAISEDNGESWRFNKVELIGFSGKVQPVDPDIQILPDGTFRLYLTSDLSDGIGPRTFFADGADGISFTFQGAAFAVPGQLVLDPSSLKIGDTWHLFNGGAAPGVNWHATSPDGKNFTLIEKFEQTIDGRKQIMANGLAESTGYRFYTFDQVSSGQSSNISSLWTIDGKNWLVEPGFRLSAQNNHLEKNGVSDPAVVRLADGTYLMVYVTGIPD